MHGLREPSCFEKGLEVSINLRVMNQQPGVIKSYGTLLGWENVKLNALVVAGFGE